MNFENTTPVLYMVTVHAWMLTPPFACSIPVLAFQYCAVPYVHKRIKDVPDYEILDSKTSDSLAV